MLRSIARRCSTSDVPTWSLVGAGKYARGNVDMWFVKICHRTRALSFHLRESFTHFPSVVQTPEDIFGSDRVTFVKNGSFYSIF